MISLRQIIEEEIHRLGPIPFSRYMELCLYHAELGYYSRPAEQFGKAGDFYTSSDVHKVFGRLLARQFEEMWRVLGAPAKIRLLELGPGRGLFAQDVLSWSEKKFPQFWRALHYGLVESSAALRKKIENNLAGHFLSGKARFETLDFPPKEKTEEKAGEETDTIVFANEFFDALPVEVLSPKGALRIDARGGRFIETWDQPSSAEMEYLDRYSVQPESVQTKSLQPKQEDRVEAGLVAQTMMEWLAAGVPRGFVVAIDYGYTREELLQGRHRGTVKAIRQHAISASPYEAPGEQDITADVNFTALAATAEKQGMRAHRLVTQSQFLLGTGEATQFADAFEECRLPQERAKVAMQLKHLITPAGMGESFHVLVASKGVAEDKVETLSGLSFGRSFI